jgi:hypothetical protein
MTPPDDFDKVAREIVDICGVPIGNDRNNLIYSISQALRTSYERGLKQAVLARVNRTTIIDKLQRFDEGGGLTASEVYDWLLSQLKPVEVRMPERARYDSQRHDDVDYNFISGFNKALDAVRALNPEIFEGKEIK